MLNIGTRVRIEKITMKTIITRKDDNEDEGCVVQFLLLHFKVEHNQ